MVGAAGMGLVLRRPPWQLVQAELATWINDVGVSSSCDTPLTVKSYSQRQHRPLLTITVPFATDASVSIGAGRRTRAASPPALQGAIKTCLGPASDRYSRGRLLKCTSVSPSEDLLSDNNCE